MKRNYTFLNQTQSDSTETSQDVFLEEEQKEKKVPGFLQKTYEMLENKELMDIVSWSQSGKSFVIKQASEFAEKVLPYYFKHQNISSFIRQLNMYDFHQFRNEDNHTEWEHTNFVRGKTQLLPKIKRKLPEFSQKLISEVAVDEQSDIDLLKESSKQMKSQIQSLFDQINSMSTTLMNAIKEQEELQKSNTSLRTEFNELLRRGNMPTLVRIQSSDSLSESDNSGNQSSTDNNVQSQFQRSTLFDIKRESDSEKPETIKLDLSEKDFDEISNENYPYLSTELDENNDFNFIRLDKKKRLVSKKEDFSFYNNNNNPLSNSNRKNSFVQYLENQEMVAYGSNSDLDRYLIC